MQALVLVGGFGTRLRPLTYHVPKAMVPIANVPFIERFVDYLEANGITHVIFAMGYLPDPIANHLAKRNGKAKYEFVVEDQPLDTGGAIKNAEPLLSERFFVFNGDILTTIPLREILRIHERKGASVTIALTPVEDPSRYGVVVTDEDGRVQAFIEKPPKETAPSNLINAGIYLYEREVLNHIPEGQPYSVERGLYPKLLEIGAPFYAVAFPNDYWLDIGKVEHYMQANFDILSGKAPLPIVGKEIQKRVWVGENVQIAPTAKIEPPVLLGDGCVIEDGATVGPLAVLGNRVIVKENASVREAVLWDECVIGKGANVERCVLGFCCKVEDNASIEPDRAYGCGERITAGVAV
ncbi:MAG: NDP-sugar synthase [Armatimonadetes bacterium]|nr:NDP-sugar synthase [Armatimonadota bacterium]